MPASEIIAPYRPASEDHTLPVILLTGSSNAGDSWSMDAVGILHSKLHHHRNRIYIANENHSDVSATDPVFEEWVNDYEQRASRNGAILAWFSSAAVLYKNNPLVDRLEELHESYPKAKIVCGAGTRANGAERAKLAGRLDFLCAPLQPYLSSTCDAAIRQSVELSAR